MRNLQPERFGEFFNAIHGHDPFPWQRMLVEQIARNTWPKTGWPEGIDLPTASGKTACLDAAVFLLALGEQNGRLPRDHPARRRIFFVVDRRIVVDEAFERAERLAQKLKDATDGIVKQVADRLRALAGDESSEPLVASRLRGGTVNDERWRLSPVQPAIITSTVDQIGSRMLFRGYGASNLSAPIDAALTACDSLILLDEAQCAAPFMQTARAVRRYSGEKWMEGEPTVSPLTLSILSATLPEDVSDVFPRAHERAEALRHDVLGQRIHASKSSELAKAKKPTGKGWSLGTAESGDDLVLDAAQRAANLAQSGRRRVAVMVNRVGTAAAIQAELQRAANDPEVELDAHVVLMTGRMRPIDRDRLVEEWSPYLRAGSKDAPEKPIILVTTQCLEVGADFSFDALITECASLDALRQRFGRLNRLGEYDTSAEDDTEAKAAVLIRKPDVKQDDKLDDGKPLDPIYGNAMARTWNWLSAEAENERFDFGIAAVDALLQKDPQQKARLAAPSPDAPVLMPAHVDLLCQTAPQPTPDPDISLFLHGPERGVPEARVVFRADLVESTETGWKDKWCDAVRLLPPLTEEALPMPLWLIRKWLAAHEKPEVGEMSDVESQQSVEETTDATFGQPFVIWRGKRDSVVSTNPRDVRPNETIVVPADKDLAARLGHAFCRPANSPLDIAEQAYPAGRNRHVLRLIRAVYQQPGMPPGLADIEPLRELLAWARDEEREPGVLNDLTEALRQHTGDEEAAIPPLPPWLRDTTDAFSKSRPRIEPHPTGGVVLLGPVSKQTAALDLDFGDVDDAWSSLGKSVSLDDHTEHVKTRAEVWARRCLPDSFAELLATAAESHDRGKADPRWQQVQMHGGDEVLAAVALEQNPPRLFAKSDQGPLRGTRYQAARDAAGLPGHFRHEMLSMQWTEATEGEITDLEHKRDLILHLIAAHHGHGRPFAPVCLDDEPPAVEFDGVTLCESDRNRLVPAHRMDSGVAERFWQLTRRHGWWGLAHLEAILRLADHAASGAEAAVQSSNQQPINKQGVSR